MPILRGLRKVKTMRFCRIHKKKHNFTFRAVYFFMTLGKQFVLIHLWLYGLLSFQAGGTKLKRCLPKNQHTQRKMLNYENWIIGKVSKSAKIRLAKSIFYVKNYLNLSLFFIELYQFRSTFFIIDIF